jgi:hypothetical protein
MAETNLGDVQNQVKKYWSEIFMPELRESHPLISLVDKTYSGEIKEAGNEVRVSQIVKATGETIEITGVAADNKFTPEKLVTRYVDIKADRRFVSSYKFHDLISLQTQIKAERSDIRESLLEGISTQMNNYLYSLVAPAAGQALTGVANMDATVLKNIRVIAGKKKWPKDAMFGLLSPDYYGDLMNETTLTSTDYVADQPRVGGEIVSRRYGFNIIEDNSDGLNSLALNPAGPSAIFFHPAYCHMVTQMQPRFKISDLHANEEFGYLISVDVIGGAKLGIEGADMHVSVVDVA